MKLPLDMFQLLGVTANADRKTILTVMERRLGECKFLGFGTDTLNKRRELLNDIGNILLDKDKRIAYEKSYVESDDDLEKAMYDVPKGGDVAGLLLVLEANHPEECIYLGEKISNRLKSKIEIDASTFGDLMLVIDYASLSYAEELKRKRFYDSAYSVAHSRIRRVEGKGLQEVQAKLSKEVEDLLPFRILDLVSRSTISREHELGKELLEKMIKASGGLEAFHSQSMDNEEFKSFLRQIRSLLTVQEQIDLFRRWSLDQSPIASFFTSTALVASGFAQRKPERLVEALKILDEINTKELEVIKANIYLLLGEIEKGNDLLNEYADEDLEKWCESQSNTRLGQQCAWCEEWLFKYVLAAYRDLEVESDLEGYFGDRDVMEYIERNDRQTEILTVERHEQKMRLIERQKFAKKRTKISEFPSNRNSRKSSVENNCRKGEVDKRGMAIENRIISALIIFSACTLLGFGIVNTISSRTRKVEYRHKPALIHYISENKHVKSEGRSKMFEDQNLNHILSTWLTMKVKALREGVLPRDINQYGTQKAIEMLRKQMQDNQVDGIIRLIHVKVKKLRVVKREDNRAIVEATLEYKEEERDRTGWIVYTVNQHTFNKIYTLVKSGKHWLVE